MLQHQPLIEADYTIASNNEYNSQYSTQPGHSSHTNGVHDSPVDQFRRDGNLSQRAASPFPYSTTHDNRMFSESGVASDATARYVTRRRLVIVFLVQQTHPSLHGLRSHHYSRSVVEEDGPDHSLHI